MSPGHSNQSRARPRVQLALLVLVVLALGAWQLFRAAEQAAPTSNPSATSPPQTASSPTEAPPATSLAAPTRDLSRDEAQGGHTLARHVGRSDADLRDRLTREPGISAASTYTNRAVAEATVGRTLAGNAARVKSWLARTGSRPNLALDYRSASADPIGRSLQRGRAQSVPCTDAIVVLRWDGRNGYYVLTSYPEVRR